MATLYDLAMQYLNQSLPETFKYDRTNQPGINPPGINPPGLFPQPPVNPIAKILPTQGGGDGFGVYNSDPNSTRTQSNYSPYAYRQAFGKTDYQDFDPSSTYAAKQMEMNPEYYEGKQLTGIPAAISNYAKNSFVGQGLNALGNMLPVNRRAILENELLGSGMQLNDIGQFVSDGGDINKADGSNIMAGYNAAKVTQETFDKRRATIEKNMKDPKQKAAKLAALDAAETSFFGAKTKADMVFDDKSLAKDPSYVPFDTQLDINNIINQEKEDDESFDPLDPIKKPTGIYTATAPTYLDNYPTTITDTPGGGDPVIDADGTAPGGGYGPDYYGGDPVIDADGTAPGGGYGPDYYGGGNDSGSSYNAGSGYNPTGQGGPAGQGSPKYGTGSGNLGDYQMQPSKPEATFEDQSYSSGGGDGGNNSGGGGTHCCTAANERGDMTLLEVKKLRVWHRKQSKIWQKGYDVWGRVMADNLVSKYKWSSDRVRDFYNHKIYGKRTIGSTFADFCIYPMSMVIGFILTVMPPILGYQKNKNKNA